MKRILTLAMGARGVDLLLDEMSPQFMPSPLHSHPYPEMHLFLEGKGVYTVEGERYPLSAGDAILIPAGQYHATAAEEGSRVRTFQIDLPASSVLRIPLPSALLSVLCLSWEEELAAVTPALCYLVATLSAPGLSSVRENDDHAYLIHEYMEQQYARPLRLSELAALLHLSERQTQREIRRLTGMSFTELLRAHRLSVAERLFATTDMTAAEVAAYVGYDTYSGFRRACLAASHGGECGEGQAPF